MKGFSRDARTRELAKAKQDYLTAQVRFNEADRALESIRTSWHTANAERLRLKARIAALEELALHGRNEAG